MSDQELTVLAFDADVYCDPDTGVCAVPAAPPQASEDPAAKAKSKGSSSAAVTDTLPPAPVEQT